jgi:four helix bundle protein
MAAPEPFRERAFRFSLSILRLYRTILVTTDVPRHIAGQMLRAGTSIGGNLEEAKSASSRRDLTAKNAIALREARECHYWLRLIQADQPTLDSAVSPVLAECHELVSLLAAAVRTLRSTT